MLKIFIFITLLSFCLFPTTKSALDSKEATSIKYLLFFYQINWNPAGTDCATIVQSSNSRLVCFIDGAGVEHIQQILVSQSVGDIQPLGPPDDSDQVFYFPYLTVVQFFITEDMQPTNMLQKSILSYFDNINNGNITSIEMSNYVGAIPASFPLNLANLLSVNIITNLIVQPEISYEILNVKSLRLSTTEDCELKVTNRLYSKLSMLSTNCQLLPSDDSNILEFNTLNFPKLQNIYLNGNPSNKKITYSFNFNSEVNLNVDGGSKKNKIINIPPSSTIKELNLANIETYSPNDLAVLKNLRFISFKNVPSITNANSLERYEYTDTPTLTSFPPEQWLYTGSDTSVEFKFNLSNNSITGDIPPYSNIHPIEVNFENNPLLTGRVPDSFCSATILKLNGSSVSALPDCVLCLNGIFPQGFSIPSNLVKPFNCIISIESRTNLYVLTYTTQNTITVRGKNLGYFSPNDYAPADRISPVIRNSVFTFTPPPIPGYGSYEIQLSKSRSINYTISWVTDNTNIETITPIYSISSLTLSIGGAFNQTASLLYSVKIDGKDCIVDIVTWSVINCTMSLNSPLVNKNINVILKSPYLNFTRSSSAKLFPIVSSYSEITTNGGSLIIGGYFGDSGHTDLNTVIDISGTRCNVDSINSLSIQCSVTNLKEGLNNVTITMKNNNFIMSQLYVSPVVPTVDCGPNNLCSGNGKCTNGRCVCNKDYYGLYCEQRIFNGGVVYPNTSAPVTSISANGYNFSFNLVGIQEIDSNENVVKELITSNWNYTSYIFNEVQYLNYTILTKDNVNILALIQHSNISREMSFANQNFTLPPFALKLSVDVNGWDYSSVLNTIRVVFNTKLEEMDLCQGEPIKTGDIDNSLKYLKVIKNGLAFYGKFLPISISDGVPTYSRNEVINQTKSGLIHIGIRLPQCSRCSIDPDFSLLIQGQDDECKPKSRTWVKITIGVVVGVVGLALLFISGFYIRKYRRNIKLNMDIVLEKFGVETKKE